MSCSSRPRHATGATSTSCEGRRSAARPGGGGRGALGGVWGAPVGLGPAPAVPPPLHVVLVSLDTLRARSVGAYGSERPTTPALDALAAEGVLFENAFSIAAFTLPGHMSMLTGLWFRTHRAITFFTPLSLEHRTLPERLASAGWATAASTSNGWIAPALGFRRGFDVYHERAHGMAKEGQP